MSYILLYPADSGSIEALNDGRELEKQLARSRGESGVVDTIDGEDGDEQAELLHAERGPVLTHSGYMMEFVTAADTALPIIDVAKKPGRQAYPVAEESVQSLPVHILSRVEKQEYVRIEAEYDADEKEFRNVSLGWDAEEKSPWDQLMEALDERDMVNPVLDYLVFTHGPERWTPEAIADVRGVEPKTVRENIKRIRAADKDQDQSGE